MVSVPVHPSAPGAAAFSRPRKACTVRVVAKGAVRVRVAQHVSRQVAYPAQLDGPKLKRC